MPNGCSGRRPAVGATLASRPKRLPDIVIGDDGNGAVTGTVSRQIVKATFTCRRRQTASALLERPVGAVVRPVSG